MAIIRQHQQKVGMRKIVERKYAVRNKWFSSPNFPAEKMGWSENTLSNFCLGQERGEILHCAPPTDIHSETFYLGASCERTTIVSRLKNSLLRSRLPMSMSQTRKSKYTELVTMIFPILGREETKRQQVNIYVQNFRQRFFQYCDLKRPRDNK